MPLSHRVNPILRLRGTAWHALMHSHKAHPEMQPRAVDRALGWDVAADRQDVDVPS